MKDHHQKSLDILKSMSQDQIDEISKKFFDKREADQKSKHDFFESDEFNKLYDKIYSYVVDNGIIHGDSVHYKQVTVITSDEYQKFTDSISSMCVEIVPEFDAFPEWYYDYRGLSVSYMSGQGTVSCIYLNKVGERNDKLGKLL